MTVVSVFLISEVSQGVGKTREHVWYNSTGGQANKGTILEGTRKHETVLEISGTKRCEGEDKQN